MPPALATYAQFVARLGSTPIGPEIERAKAALEDASALVRNEAGEEWLDDDGDLETVPAAIVAVTLEVARRAFKNPDGVSQAAVGDVSVSYARDDGSGIVYLTRDERRVIRRAGGRQAVGSIQLTAPAPEEVPTGWEV